MHLRDSLKQVFQLLSFAEKKDNPKDLSIWKLIAVTTFLIKINPISKKKTINQ